MGWLVPYSSLTPEQQQAVMLPMEGHRVIVGGPGAGKTLLLLHRFSYLFQLHGADPAVGKLFAFTTTLKDFIRSALADVDVPESCVSTFDKWCADFYREHVGKSVPWRQDGTARGPDFAAIRTAVHEAVVQRGVMKGRYAFAVVDEGQDLTTQAMEIIAGVSQHAGGGSDQPRPSWPVSGEHRTLCAVCCPRVAPCPDQYSASPKFLNSACSLVSHSAK